MNETPETRPKKRHWRIGPVVMLLRFGCSSPWDWSLFRAPTPLTETPKPDGKKTSEEFRAAIKSYPYEAPQARKDMIVNNYAKLEIGMSKNQVAELIGDPDYSRLDYGPK